MKASEKLNLEDVVKEMDPAWLAVTSDAKVPLRSLLQSSIYYPACGLDGDPVKYLSKHFGSFVYVDYGIPRETVESCLQNFKGYCVKRCRLVVLPRPLNHCGNRRQQFKHGQFCLCSIHERLPDFGPEHGPKYFSLLYIGGEGVATFERLYHHFKTAPAVIAIIQPGTGFGNNWTAFEDQNGPFARAVMSNPGGAPNFLLYGGWADGSKYRDPCWSQFDQPKGVLHGRLRLWARGSGELSPLEIAETS